MKYIRFNIEQYKAVKKSSIALDLKLIPLIGINESGKSSALEAIAHYEYRNDSLANERSWKFINRYRPSEKRFLVEAEIMWSKEEVQEIIEKFSEEEKKRLSDIFIKKFQSVVKIIRVFVKAGDQTSKKYHILGHEDDLIERFSKEVINRLPKIIYFDNFLEHPFQDELTIPNEYDNDPNFQLGEYESMLERMFELSGCKLREFLLEKDQNTRNTYIGQVNDFVTKQIIQDWEKMNVREEDIDTEFKDNNLTINLQQAQEDPRKIKINIKESFKNETGETQNTHLLLSERSLGFRWYFNFSVRKCFGTKGEEKFIYLIDEPGSFLHNSAQSILIKSIKDLSKNHPIIFSTHSEFLLDPDVVNINNIKVLEKKQREIKLLPLSQTKDKKMQGSLSPLFNALRTKIPVANTLNQKVIVTEGITDYYFWKMIIKNVIFLPGFGAKQNKYLISIAIGTSSKYVALFDGDRAGDDAINYYRDFFKDDQAANWKQYIDNKGNKIKLEQLLSLKDQDRIKDVTKAVSVKKAITILYFSNKNQISKFWNNIDNESKNNIKNTLQLIKSTLKIRLNSYFNYIYK